MGLDTLFDPDEVALVGATDREGSVGRAILENLRRFDGEVVAVNPDRESVLGVDCRDEVPGFVDLAVIVVPAEVAVREVEQCAAAGVENVVVISAGFGETGGEGPARQRRLVEVADEHDLSLVGPNSLGVVSTPAGLNCTFGPDHPDPGGVSFMSQSGAFVTAVLNWAAERELGFKDVVSLGNKAVLDETDFAAFWGDDPCTDVVLGYLEDVVDGQAFVETMRRTTADTPVVVVKSGRTEAGAKAAASHTGAIAGSGEAYRAAMDAAGVMRADTVQELFDWGAALAGQPVPEGDGVAVVSNAGGPGVMATDAVGASGLELASFGDDTRDRLRAVLPAAASAHNPVDLIGDAPASRFGDALDAVLVDPAVSAAVVLTCPTATMAFEDVAQIILDRHRTHGTPTAAVLMGGESTRGAAGMLARAGIPTYFDPARAVDALDALRRYREIRDRTYAAPMEFAVDRERVGAILRTYADRDHARIGVEAMEILEAYGIPTPEDRLVDGPGEATEAARSLDRGAGVVMKLVSPDILHKSDVGGVEVGVAPGDAADVFESLVTRARNYQPDATVLGVQVQERVDTEGKVETIAGTNRDPQFGPLVLFGLGGVFVEALEDTALRIAPLSDPDARGMIDDLQAAPLLRGARGREPVDEDAVVSVLGRLSRLVTDFPAILELDVNPLVAGPDGATAVDLRLTIDPEEL